MVDTINKREKKQKRGRPFEPGRPGGPGRPVGAKGRVAQSLKAAIEQSFHEVGGVEYLKRVAEKDPSTFLGILGKVLPREVQVDLNAHLNDMTPDEREQAFEQYILSRGYIKAE